MEERPENNQGNENDINTHTNTQWEKRVTTEDKHCRNNICFIIVPEE